MSDQETSSKAMEITADNFDAEVLHSATPVLVDFWAAWCGPCKAMAPVLEEAQQARGEGVRIVKVDVDRDARLAALHGIRSLPTLTFFRQGQKVDELIGLQSLHTVLARIDANASA